MRYQFIDASKNTWPISLMCKLLEVSRPGYYSWRNRPESKQADSNKKLGKRIQEIYEDHDACYGSPRITIELLDEGVICSENRVARQMKQLGLRSVHKPRFKVTTNSDHNLPVAADLLEQDFSASEPNQKWTQDITYIWTDEGWMYLAVVMDLFSRSIVGWSMNRRMTQSLVCDALTSALFRRGFPREVIVHSDRGSQYCSHRFQQLLQKHSLLCSMSRTGCCYDNAVTESFFHTLKVERVHRKNYRTREEAKNCIFNYIEIYYNRKRRHSAIDNNIPMLYEQAMAS
jgi:transposase InsO family protein